MNPTKKQADIAGILCISASLAAVFAWMYVNGYIFVRLWIAAFGYLANSAVAILAPAYRQAIGQFADPVQMAELPIIFWLLIWGEKVKPVPPLPPANSLGQ